MGLIQDFMADAPGFLAAHAVIVGDETEWDGKPIGAGQFFMKAGGGNIVYLNRRTIGKMDGTEKAYWLPWKSKQGVALTLGTDAEWLFTSEMTNCRFTILTEGGRAIKVAHLAGDLPAGKQRTDWEEKQANAFITDKATQIARRMSRSGNDLKYVGNIKDDQTLSSSAFVFGRREGGDWKFYAQVVGGFRTVQNTHLLKDNIKILTEMGAV